MPRARMLKTLGCLVGAMTAASALLGWIEPLEEGPSSLSFARLEGRFHELQVGTAPTYVGVGERQRGYVRAAPSRSQYGTILRLARSVVLDDVSVRKDQWERLEILTGPVMAASAPFLIATADRNSYHFHVDLEGRPSRTNRWLRQEALTSHPRTVKIQVARGEKGNQSTSGAQWDCVRALIAVLGEELAPQGASLPVRFQVDRV